MLQVSWNEHVVVTTQESEEPEVGLLQEVDHVYNPIGERDNNSYASDREEIEMNGGHNSFTMENRKEMNGGHRSVISQLI